MDIRSRDRTRPEVKREETLGTKPNGGGTRQGPTAADLVMLSNYGNTNRQSRPKTQSEVKPEEMLRPNPMRKGPCKYRLWLILLLHRD